MITLLAVTLFDRSHFDAVIDESKISDKVSIPENQSRHRNKIVLVFECVVFQKFIKFGFCRMKSGQIMIGTQENKRGSSKGMGEIILKHGQSKLACSASRFASRIRFRPSRVNVGCSKYFWNAIASSPSSTSPISIGFATISPRIFFIDLVYAKEIISKLLWRIIPDRPVLDCSFPRTLNTRPLHQSFPLPGTPKTILTSSLPTPNPSSDRSHSQKRR